MRVLPPSHSSGNNPIVKRPLAGGKWCQLSQTVQGGARLNRFYGRYRLEIREIVKDSRLRLSGNRLGLCYTDLQELH